MSRSRRRTQPAFPTLPLFQRPSLRRPPVAQRATAPPADRDSGARTFPSYPIRENAAVESVSASPKKGARAFRPDNKTSHRTHRRSTNFHARRECPPKSLPEGRRASTRDRASAARDRRKLQCPAPSALSTNRELPDGTGQTFLQTSKAAPTRPKQSTA